MTEEERTIEQPIEETTQEQEVAQQRVANTDVAEPTQQSVKDAEVVGQDVEKATDMIAQPTDIADDSNNKSNEVAKKKSLKALVQYIKAHEELRQMVLFLLFSFLCAAAQTVTQFVLKYAIGAANDAQFEWFLFKYPYEKGLAEFIGFICGAIIGQVMTFVLNRKKTFKATNNVVIAGIMYAIIAICIILLQTYLGGVITDACNKAAVANGTNTEGIVGFLITLTGMAVGGICALVLSFLGNKYLVMRNWGKKKSAQQDEQLAQQEQQD